jgi:hypothetical protein
MTTSPLQLTHKYLRERAMLIEITEHWNYYGKVKQDLFGFADTIALNPTTFNDVLLIQSTDSSNHSHRVTKILANDKLPIILRHCRVEVWSWGKKGARGKPKVMTLRRTGFRFNKANLRSHFSGQLTYGSAADYSIVCTFESTDPLY